MEPSLLNIGCLGFSAFALLYGLYSMFLKERLYLSEALLATLIGILLKPLFDSKWFLNDTEILFQSCRFIIAIQVMAAGVSLPAKYLWKEWKSLFFLLGPLMIVSWLIVAVLISFLFDLDFADSLLISSCVTPTDPILANSIVKGRFAEKYVPKHIRLLLSAESGANDGLGYVFFIISISLKHSTSVTSMLQHLVHVLLKDIVLAIAVGTIVGYLARKAILFSYEHQLVDHENFLSYALLLALFLVGSLGILQSDDLLACFVAGNVLTNDDFFRTQTMDYYIQEVIDNILNLAFFVFWGISLDLSLFFEVHVGKLFLLCVGVLVFKRLPILVLCHSWIPAVHNLKEAAFTGWFGPIGVSALYYLTLAIQKGEGPLMIVPIVNALVLSSVFVHGMSIPFFKLTRLVTKTKPCIFSDKEPIKYPDSVYSGKGIRYIASDHSINWN